MSASAAIASIEKEQMKQGLPEFRAGDSVKVYAKITEGTKERVQVFEGVVIQRHSRNKFNATFTVRKVSYNVGVERTFLLHSPRIERIEVVSCGSVRRSKLFYLRDLRGKSAKIKRKDADVGLINSTAAAQISEGAAVETKAE